MDKGSFFYRIMTRGLTSSFKPLHPHSLIRVFAIEIKRN